MKAGGATATASDTVTGTASANGALPQPSLPDCQTLLPGSTLQSLNVLGGRTGFTVPNPEVNVTKTLYTGTAAGQYPICTTGAGCFLDLLKNGVSCLATNVYCANWVADFQSGTPTATYTCMYGPYKLTTSACIPDYGTAFDKERQPDPGTSPGPAGQPTATPTVSPGGNPLPTTGPNPQPSGAPTQGTTNPDPGTGPGVGTVPNSQDCWGSGWSWNPISWVVIPVECSLKWAFVPNSTPNWGDIQNPLPTGWIPSFPALSDGSCGPVTMPSISLGHLGGNSGTITLFNSCNAPWPFARNLTYYGILAVGLIGLGYRGFEMVMKALGMDVSAGGGGGDDE